MMEHRVPLFFFQTVALLICFFSSLNPQSPTRLSPFLLQAHPCFPPLNKHRSTSITAINKNRTGRAREKHSTTPAKKTQGLRSRRKTKQISEKLSTRWLRPIPPSARPPPPRTRCSPSVSRPSSTASATRSPEAARGAARKRRPRRRKPPPPPRRPTPSRTPTRKGKNKAPTSPSRPSTGPATSR